MPKTRTNQEWIQDLTFTGQQQAEAIEDLRQLLLRASLYVFNRNPGDLHGLDPQDKLALAEDCAQNALIAVLSQLKEFRSEAKFTTWAFKFAVNVALPCLRRERWKRVSQEKFDENLDSLDWLKFRLENTSDDPDRAALQAEIYAALRDAMRDQLTPKQRQVVKLIVFDEVPMDVVVQHFGTNRNAIYKLLHDARRKIKSYLKARGFHGEEIQDLFSLKK